MGKLGELGVELNLGAEGSSAESAGSLGLENGNDGRVGILSQEVTRTQHRS